MKLYIPVFKNDDQVTMYTSYDKKIFAYTKKKYVEDYNNLNTHTNDVLCIYATTKETIDTYLIVS